MKNAEELKKLAKVEWDRDSKLRVEFGGDFDAYLAFFEAEQNGQVKILGGKRKERTR